MNICFKEGQNDWFEGVSILLAVLIVVLVTASNDWSKEKQFNILQSKLDSEYKISVLRDQLIQEVNIKKILVGDIVFLNCGNIIPADGILLEANDLKVDEAVLTGESDLVKKCAFDIVYNSNL